MDRALIKTPYIISIRERLPENPFQTEHKGLLIINYSIHHKHEQQNSRDF